MAANIPKWPLICVSITALHPSILYLIFFLISIPSVDPPIEMKRISDKLEVISISNDGDEENRNEMLIRLAKDLAADPIVTTSKTKSNASTSLFDANAQNISISIPLKSIQKDKQQQQQRPNKLSRSRPSTNQQKTKTSNHTTEISLMALDALALKPYESHTKRHHATPTSATATTSAAAFVASSSTSHANTALTLAQSMPSTSYAHTSTNGMSTTPFISTLQNPPRHPAIASTSSGHQTNASCSASGTTKHIQDGTTKVTVVQPATTSAAANTNSFEPELVLSPANLGQ